jgi:hypothetical protein
MGGAFRVPEHHADDRVEHPLRRPRSVFDGFGGPPPTARARPRRLSRPGCCRTTSSSWPGAGSRPDDSIALGDEHPLETTRIAANPIVRYIADALPLVHGFHARYDLHGAFIHDPLALAAALDQAW